MAEPKADNFAPGFLRQRRNLLLCTSLIFVMNLGVFELTGISVAGLGLKLLDAKRLDWLILGLELLDAKRLDWLILGLEMYFLLRFFAYRRGFEHHIQFSENYHDSIKRGTAAIFGRRVAFFDKKDLIWKYTLFKKGVRFNRGGETPVVKDHITLPKNVADIIKWFGWIIYLSRYFTWCFKLPTFTDYTLPWLLAMGVLAYEATI